MTLHFHVSKGPSREDLFDNLRLANATNRLLPLKFTLRGGGNLFITELYGMERVIKEHRHPGFLDGQHTRWIVKAVCTHLPEYMKEVRDPMFLPHEVEIDYDTNKRSGTLHSTSVVTTP